MSNEGASGRSTMLWQKLIAVFALVLLPFGQAQATTVTAATLDGVTPSAVERVDVTTSTRSSADGAASCV